MSEVHSFVERMGGMLGSGRSYQSEFFFFGCFLALFETGSLPLLLGNLDSDNASSGCAIP